MTGLGAGDGGGAAGAPRVTPVVRVAPAKLNLTLAVVRQREDGFHDLHSIMAPLGLADALALAPALGEADTVHVTGPAGTPAPDLGPAARNVVLAAIATTRRAVRNRVPDLPLPPLAARLAKRIPVAAGLAGGSSDAWAAIDGALEAWGAESALDGPARLAVAAAVGSDVPFFAAGGWALVEGRGERVSPLPGPRGPAPWVLLVTPRLAVATADVFALHAAGARRPAGAARASSAHLAGELAAGLDAGRLLERAGILAVANDLAPATAAAAPGMVGFRRALGRLLGRPVGQSGSGPTLWVLYPAEDAVAAAAAAVGDALRSGSLEAPGDGAPFVTGTVILSAAAAGMQPAGAPVEIPAQGAGPTGGARPAPPGGSPTMVDVEHTEGPEP